MATFVLMTKLGPGVVGDRRTRRERGREWKAAVDAHCPSVRWIAHYALLGQYDFMDVYEAPDAATAFRVSSLSRAHGAITAESWPAVSYESYLGLVEPLEPGAARDARDP